MLTARHTACLTALLLACFASTAHGGDIQKLGFIDTQRVYQQSTQAQQIQNILQREFGERQRALQALRERVARLKADFLRSGNQRPHAGSELLAAEAELTRQTVEFTEAYNLRRQEEFAALQLQANNIIEQIAQRGGYDLILGEVIYVDNKFDITDEVIRELNRSHSH